MLDRTRRDPIAEIAEVIRDVRKTGGKARLREKNGTVSLTIQADAEVSQP